MQHPAVYSIVVADFYAQSFVTGELYPGMKKSLKTLKITDEEIGFGIDFSSDYVSALNKFLDSANTKVGETHFMGYHTKKGTWMVVTEIEI